MGNFDILWRFGIFQGYLSTLWGDLLYFSFFGLLYLEKSGNPVLLCQRRLERIGLEIVSRRNIGQGCQMVSFQTKNPILGKF
jgi:hypothetical protein